MADDAMNLIKSGYRKGSPYRDAVQAAMEPVQQAEYDVSLAQEGVEGYDLDESTAALEKARAEYESPYPDEPSGSLQRGTGLRRMNVGEQGGVAQAGAEMAAETLFPPAQFGFASRDLAEGAETGNKLLMAAGIVGFTPGIGPAGRRSIRFFSQMTRGAEKLKDAGRAIGVNELEPLMLKEGVKKAELEQTGFYDWVNQLKEDPNVKSIQPDELLDFARQNELPIRPTEPAVGREGRFAAEFGEGDKDYYDYIAPGDSKDYQVTLLQSAPPMRDPTSPDFFDFDERSEYYQRFHEEGELPYLQRQFHSDLKKAGVTPTGDDVADLEALKARGQELEGESFRHHMHFPSTPNILVHARTTTRTDPDGRKILFVEEVQSDLHQTARKLEKGTYKPTVDGGYRFKSDDLEGDSAEAMRKRLQAFYQVEDDGLDVFLRRKRSELGTFSKQVSDDTVLEMVHIDMANNARFQKGLDKDGAAMIIPDVSHKKTDEWSDLALRSLVAKAVNEGYDGVALARGFDNVHAVKMPTSAMSFYDKYLPGRLQKVLSKEAGVNKPAFQQSVQSNVDLGVTYPGTNEEIIQAAGKGGRNIEEGFALPEYVNSGHDVVYFNDQITDSFYDKPVRMLAPATTLMPAGLAAKRAMDKHREEKE